MRDNREVFPETDPDEQLRQHIADLEARLQSLQSRLPAHSILPSLLAELDELDGQLAKARHLLSQKGRVAGGSP